MKRWSRRRPPDPRTFNLLGLAQLPTSPQQAADAFKSALRCDLRYGPAYLNLALAYDRLGQRPAAVLCLRRSLQLMPQGPLARDAQRRLGELREPAAPGGAAP
jgi:tetratricopeptide (TPR) repeat protein